MATLTEKQEAVKEILGSTDSIRKFVQDGGIHLEDLRTYISRLEAVEKLLEESKKKEAIENAKAKLDSAREELALSGFSKSEIASILGVGTTSKQGPEENNKKRGASKGIVRAKYIFPLLDGTESEPLAVQGKRKTDSPVMLACIAAGYESLSAWVKGDSTIKQA